ncbi:hypothetical protein BH23CHL8_BH23CHL8_06400 [soil metagenome]
MRPTPLALVMLCLATAGCYSLAEPSLRPGDSRDILLALDRRDVRVESILAGDSACADPALVANALRLQVTTERDPLPLDVYIYSFRVRSWDDSADRVDACEAEYAADHPGLTVSRVDVPTYRAFGAGWSTELEVSVREAFNEASSQGS